ncbi:DegT/DnrJ/EryC1/StrS family aminotransferase [Candidatus Pyrohabitans sp.]
MFPHRRPSKEARLAMCRAAKALDVESNAELVMRASEAVAKLTGHSHARVVASGSCAVLAALSAVEGRVMLPDQGGWRGFKAYAQLLGKEVCEVKTELGVIHAEALEEALGRHKPGALLITSFAGYIAEQDVRAIHELCEEHGTLLIEDASSAIGDRRLAQGENADIIICSTGDPKITNLTAGGFISTGDEEFLRRAAKLIKACRPSGILAAGLVEELKIAPAVVERLTEFSELLKSRLPGVVHPERRGVCVGVLHPSPREVKARARGLTTDLGKSLLTLCPSYDRFLAPGVCIELKKLDVLKLDKSDVLILREKLKEALT